MDAAGRTIRDGYVHGEHVTISGSGLAPGAYILRFSSDPWSQSFKVLVPVR
jgi:hypothetical protein